jgi:hypothetical protein
VPGAGAGSPPTFPVWNFREHNRLRAVLQQFLHGDEHEISAKIRAKAVERDVDVRIAYDAMKLTP